MCSRCLHSGRECKLAFKFKSAKDSFRRNQRWLKTPRRLTYIDETTSLILGNSAVEALHPHEIAQSPTSTRDDASEKSNGPVQDASDYRTTVTPDAGQDHRLHHHQQSPHSRVVPRSEPSPTAISSSIERSSVSVSDSPSSHVPAPNVGRGSLPTPTRSVGSLSHLPLQDTFSLMNETEAQLFRHYVQRLAVCLDLTDPLRTFELVVPQRATMCPTLLKAIYAISARHLSQTSEYDPLASNRYHDECLGYLIPMLNNSYTVSDENLFAATIILRMLEEMDASSGQDNHGHLLGIHAFVNVGDQIMLPGSLSAASYWVGLRQEIYSAISTQSPVKMTLEHFIVDRSFEPTDDYTWSNRAVVNLADVLNFCFSDVAPSNARWVYLNEQCMRWDETHPPSFDPFFFKEREGSAAFPQIWYHSSCHVIGVQHHILAQLFLAQFDPTIPRVGTKRADAVKRMTKRIDDLVRQICGIGACNQWTPPALFTASMGIAMFGDRFDERADQEAMLDVLRKTETNHARPTKAIQQQLMRVWGWIPNYDGG
ncbi:hypothetical protein JX265_002206 [Neoarthrinium moseri]|uniref:Arca-like protein n=1 Tax=Neoarthrinium moseri TaxID=1658444 RepID=A0A9Q0ATA3_9PEZI|nr:uncharacterized protein JN550_007515 [Neoarthrinium moseri]KAI1850308.1 hypothetical protein JX266_004166 [Neoarthrinium moseri]KAI1866662.1 hypothetical protein JN550_007515 [Neoarthrinium moseri]KAI1879252.1 hypothetical protein JX265_002206 [Neoarthrinium moseri]